MVNKLGFFSGGLYGILKNTGEVTRELSIIPNRGFLIILNKYQRVVHIVLIICAFYHSTRPAHKNFYPCPSEPAQSENHEPEYAPSPRHKTPESTARLQRGQHHSECHCYRPQQRHRICQHYDAPGTVLDPGLSELGGKHLGRPCNHQKQEFTFSNVLLHLLPGRLRYAG